MEVLATNFPDLKHVMANTSLNISADVFRLMCMPVIKRVGSNLEWLCVSGASSIIDAGVVRNERTAPGTS